MTCPTCEAPLGVPVSAAGKTVRCPRCKEPFKVPEVAVAVAVPAPDPANDLDFFSDATPAVDEPKFPHFHVIDPDGLQNFRLYIGDGELVGVYLGQDWIPPVWLSGAGIGAFAVGMGAVKGTIRDGLTEALTAGAIGAAIGAVGGALCGALVGLALDSFRGPDPDKYTERRARVDKKPLHLLRRDHELNFVIKARNIEDALIYKPSVLFRLWNRGAPHEALLKLYLRDRDDLVLGLTTLSDVRRLTKLLGELTERRVRTFTDVSH